MIHTIGWKRGKRLNDWAMSYYSNCGRYRVDRVNTMGRSHLWRALIFTVNRWEFLNRKYYRSRAAAEEACEQDARRTVAPYLPGLTA